MTRWKVVSTSNLLHQLQEENLDPEPLVQAMTTLAQAYDKERDFFFLNMSGIKEDGNEIETKVWAKVDDYNGFEGIDRLVTLMRPEDY